MIGSNKDHAVHYYSCVMMASGIYLPLSGSYARLICFVPLILGSLFQERRFSLHNPDNQTQHNPKRQCQSRNAKKKKEIDLIRRVRIVFLGRPSSIHHGRAISGAFAALAATIWKMCLQMPTKLVQAMEIFPAMLAYVTTADIMRAAMLGKVGGFTKALPTNFAHQRLLSGVRAHMHGLTRC
jgi:hypothetical protein